MRSTTFSIGQTIDARCSKCDKVTNHVIMAMAGTKPANVQCNTCNGTHRYRSHASLPKTVKQASGSPAVNPQDWSELKTAMGNGLARDYDMEKEYRVGTLIRHSSFGFGLVQRVFGTRKMEVLFEDGKRTMRCK